MPSVPLLPAPVRSVRDAARAVKRLAGQAIQTVTEVTLSQFLDLPEFRVLGYTLEEQGEVRWAPLRGGPLSTVRIPLDREA